MIRFAFLPLAAALALSACGQTKTADGENADDFAARVNGGSATASSRPQADATPAATATPMPGAAEGQFVPGTATDPQANGCAAPKVAPFYGKQADEPTRVAIMEAIAPQRDVRFLSPGSTVQPDPNSRRLNVMLDASGIIRDARCGN